MIRAIFFDIDGTLFSHSKNVVSESVKEALSYLHEKGILLFIATGRSRNELLNIHMDELPFNGYVSLNGALCYDRQWNVIYRNPIPASDMTAVETIYNNKEVPVIVTQETSSCINFLTKQVEEGYRRILLPVPEEGKMKDEPAYQVTIHNQDDYVEEILKSMPNCTSISWHGLCSDILPLSGGKDKGLQAMMACFGLEKEEVMAFGDGDNDAVMLEAAGLGIAMGNGTAKAKAAADYVTDSIDEDGLVKALIRFELLPKTH